MILLPFIYFSIIFLFWGRKKALNVGNYVILIYAISSFFSILIFSGGNFQSHTGHTGLVRINFFACLVYCFLITLSILPFSKFRNEEIERISKPDPTLFKIVSYFLFVTFLITLFQLKDELSKLSLENLSQIRGEVYTNDGDVKKYQGLNYYLKIFVNIFSTFWPISLLFYFYSIAFLKKSKFFNILLLVSSFSSVLSGLAIAGRTQIIYWVLNFGFFYVLFNQFLPKKQKWRLKLVGVSIFIIILSYFLAVTFSRWGQGSNDSIANYSGQSFINFNIFFENYTNKELILDRILPFSTNLITGKDFDLNSYRYRILSTEGFNIGVFYSFLGDLLVDLGTIGMFIFVILFFLISSKSLKRKKLNSLSFSQLFLLVIFINIPLQGLFYYSYWKIGNEIFVWGSIIFYFLFKYKYTWRKTY